MIFNNAVCKDESKKISVIHWLLLIAIGVFMSIVWYGNFEISQIDNSQTLTFMKMFRDPSLYPDTFLLKQAYSIHLYSVYYILAGLIGTIVDPYWGLYGYFIAINCLCICGIFYLAHTITKNTMASYLSVLALTLQWQFGHALGGSSELGICPYPDLLATGVLLYSIAFFVRGRVLAAFIVVGLTFNIHMSFSALLFLAMCLSMLLQKKWKSLFVGCMLFIVGAIPMLAYMIAHPILAANQIPSESWYHIVRLRSSGHTMPLSWGFGRYAKFVPYLMLLYYGCRVGIKNGDEEKVRKLNVCVSVVVGIFILCICGVVFSEWIPVEPIIKMTVFRCTRFIVIMAVIVYMGVAVENIKRDCWSRVIHVLLIVAVISASFPIMYLTLIFLYWRSLKTKNKTVSYLAIIFMVLISMYAGCHYGVEDIMARSNLFLYALLLPVLILFNFMRRFFVASVWKYISIALIVLIVGLVSHSYPLYSDRSYYSSVKDVQLWLKKYADKGSLVVYPPNSYIWSGLSERGDYFNYCQFGYVIYADFLGPEIIKRMKLYIPHIETYENQDGLIEDMTSSYDGWSNVEFDSIARDANVGYAIVGNDRDLDFLLLYENAVFRVYDIRKRT